MSAPFLINTSPPFHNDYGIASEPRAFGASRLVNVFRRGSVPSDRSDTDSPPSSRRSSVAEIPRRPSRPFVLRLKGRRKQSHIIEVEEEEDKQDHRLGELIFSLPVEIQGEVLRYLGLKDIFALRLSSKGAAAIVEHNASDIARYLLKDVTIEEDERYIRNLFPSTPRIGYPLQISHRQGLVDKLINMMISFIQIKIYMITRNHRAIQFRPYRNHLRRSFHRGAWTIYHYLESYRDLLTLHHPKHQHPSLKTTQCPECTTYIDNLLESYPKSDLLPSYYFYQLIQLHLRGATRPPTYAGTLERKFRGWTRKPATEADLGRFMILGCYPEIVKISMMHGSYNQRLEILSSYTDECVISADRGVEHEKNFMEELETPFELISDEVNRSTPELKDFFWPEWKAKILEEGLVEGEKALEWPWHYVQQVMSEGAEEVVDIV